MGERGPIKGSNVVQMRKSGSARSGKKNQAKKPTGGRPAVPSWVPPEGRRFVRKLLPFLEENDLLDPAHAGSLAAMGSVYAILAMAMKELAKDGVSVPDPDHPVEDEEGGEGAKKPAIRKHPLISVVMAANEKLNAWAKEFALTPAAKLRLNIQPPKAVNKLGKFVQGKKY